VRLFRETHAERALAVPGLRALASTFLKAAVAGILYEGIKDLLFPHITLAESQGVTVALFGVAAAATHYGVQRSRGLLLAQREARFQLLFANNPLPMWVTTWRRCDSWK